MFFFTLPLHFLYHLLLEVTPYWHCIFQFVVAVRQGSNVAVAFRVGVPGLCHTWALKSALGAATPQGSYCDRWLGLAQPCTVLEGLCTPEFCSSISFLFLVFWVLIWKESRFAVQESAMLTFIMKKNFKALQGHWKIRPKALKTRTILSLICMAIICKTGVNNVIWSYLCYEYTH